MKMITRCLSVLLTVAALARAKQEIYILSNGLHSAFAQLDINPYSGIQECIAACNMDENCYAFGTKPRINSDQIDCYINNGTGFEELDADVEVWSNEERCPQPFTHLGNLTGCYYPALNEEVTWDDAQSACQTLDPQAHLITLDSEKV